MDIAKSLFNQRDRVGYVGRDDHKRTIENASFDNDGDLFCEPLDEAYAPTPGGPFSALTPTMWPRDVLTEEPENEESENGSRTQYDEFGFHLDEKYSKDSSNKLFKEPFVEDSQHKLQWMAHLDFCEKGEVNDSERYSFSKTPGIQKLVHSGIPHSLRPNLWMQMSGANKKKKEEELSYQEIIQESSDDTLSEILLIERDLLRIMPGNACFMHLHSPGVPRLRRLLRCLAWLYPEVGYCHGLATIAASLLLFCEEEDAFWIVCAIVEELLPASYYSSSFLGVQTDQRVLTSLFSSFMPELNSSLHKHDLELPLITQNWFLTLFASVVHMRVLLRIWDCLFFEGSTILFQITLGMLKLNEISLQQLQNSAEIFNSLSDIPSQLDDIDQLLKTSFEVASSLSSSVIEVHRRRHLAYLVADQGLVVNPKTHLTKRQIKKSRSMFQMLLFGEESGDIKSKNVKQTEILVDLREAIMQVARHFMAVEPKLCSNLVLVADYRMESHSTDHENYINVSRNRKRRAKALLDFERHDDDELGFRKNDIITVISQKDEHCWVGELNGLRGWFPAKFVQPLDERSKQYSSAGDDSVWETVTDLVRGFLGPAFKRVLEHGMRRPSFLGGPCHPWLFIEEAASREVERDFDSVYSRLVLCKTYRLDEDGKVLTPEELLYRCVQAVNLTHDAAHAQMDVKLRSLVCLGLNEQALHLWLEVLCSSTQVVNKWYNPWSFMCSPGWVQVKCELRILSQFAFNLNPEWELPAKKDVQTQPLKDGVRDMLVKHHLFSWDL